MKTTTVFIFMIFIFLGGITGVSVQKENTEVVPESVKEKALSIPTVVQQTQSGNKKSTNQLQLLDDAMNQQIAASEVVPPGYSAELLDVKFREGTNVDPPEEALPPDLRNAVASIRGGFSLSEEQRRRTGADRLRLWFRIRLQPGVDPVDFIERLKRLSNVESAQFVPKPAPPPGGN